MSRSTRPLCLGWLVFFPLLAMGCSQKHDAPAPVPLQAAEQAPPQPAPDEPCEVELSDPKVTFRDPTTVLFEVKYRFTKGRPNKCYCCEISFPGHPDRGEKRMESWELKLEGVIKDGLPLSQPGVKTFEILLSEAPSQRAAFKQISNVVSGPVK